MGLFKRECASKEENVIDMLAAALDRHNLSEIEYGRYGIKLRLSKYGMSRKSSQSNCCQSSEGSDVLNSKNNDISGNKSDKKDDVLCSDLNAVKSPMVGVVYLSPNPSQPSYVKKGDEVKVGETLCLIEAMKTFNPVKADRSGIIKEILVKEAQSVEYGEPLFIIE